MGFQRRHPLLLIAEVARGHKAAKLAWLRQPSGRSNAEHLLEHIDRVAAMKRVRSLGKRTAVSSPEPVAEDAAEGVL
jgi:hypothetical protein